MIHIIKSSILFAIFAVVGVASVAGQTPPALELYGSLGFGRTLSGFQKDLAEDALDPTPDTVNPFEFRIGAAAYPVVPWLGVEAYYTASGRSSANSDQVSEALSLYEYTAIAGGVALRGSVPIEGGFGLVSLSGGLRRSSPAIAGEFEDVLGFTTSDIDPGTGWYVSGRFGGTGGIFYGAMQIDYIADTGTVVSSGRTFDGNHFLFHFLVGMGLFGSDA